MATDFLHHLSWANTYNSNFIALNAPMRIAPSPSMIKAYVHLECRAQSRHDQVAWSDLAFLLASGRLGA
jgi:beta-lactamase class A